MKANFDSGGSQTDWVYTRELCVLDLVLYTRRYFLRYERDSLSSPYRRTRESLRYLVLVELPGPDRETRQR